MPNTTVEDRNSELGYSVIPDDSSIALLPHSSGGWVFAKPGSPGGVVFGLGDAQVFAVWAAEVGMSVSWSDIRQAIVDHAVASKQRRSQEAEDSRLEQVRSVTARVTLVESTSGLLEVTHPDGRFLGWVVNRDTPGGAWWAIIPENAAHDVNTAPTNGWGRTPREAARGLVDLVTRVEE